MAGSDKGSNTKTFQIRDVYVEAITAYQMAANKMKKSYKDFFDDNIQIYCREILQKKPESNVPAKSDDIETMLDDKFNLIAKVIEEQRANDKENRREELDILVKENAELKKLISDISNNNEKQRLEEQQKREEEKKNREEEEKLLRKENAELKDLLNKTLEAVEKLKDEKSKSFFKKIFS